MLDPKRIVGLVAVSLLLAASVVFGQGNLGGLTGRITDPTGAAIPEVNVVMTNLATGISVTVASTTDGSYLVASLPEGQYRLTLTKAGFKTYTQEPVVISTATVSTVNVAMVVGEVRETVTVTAQTIELETTTAESGTVMPDRSMLDLPLSLGGTQTIGASGRRQIESFIFLTPGVTGNQWSKQINGAPGFSQEVLYDGVDAQTFGAPGFIAASSPPYEAVSEFKVQNTLFPAEYGKGYGVLNFTLKSGTNAYHGDLFEFARNDLFDACGFYCSQKPILRQNEFGGTFGGPVRFPHYNGKDKTWFFFSYSGFRLRGGLPHPGLDTMPTTLERSGDFTDYPFPIYDPATTQPDGTGGFTRQQISCNGVLNVICPSRISAVAGRVIPLITPAETTAYFNNYVDQSKQPTTANDYSIKIDHQFNEKQRVSGSFWWDRENAAIYGGNAGPLNAGFRNTPTNAGGLRLNFVDNISPTLLNHIGFGYMPEEDTWSHWSKDPHTGNEIFQIPGIPADAPGYPSFNFDQLYYPMGNSDNNDIQPMYFHNWSINDDLTWVKGRHEIKFGAEFRRRRMTVQDNRNIGGIFTFDSNSTSLPDSSSFAIWGNSFASFLLGQVYGASWAKPAPTRTYFDDLWGFYAEDTIKLTSKATLNIGLRYELPIYAKEVLGQESYLDINTPNPGAGGLPGALIFHGNGAGRTGTFNIFGSYHDAFAPRIALTYAFNSKTVARMGYGVFRIYPNYGRLNGCNFWCGGFGEDLATSTTNSGVTPAFLLDNGVPSSPTPPIFDPTLDNNGAITWVNPSSNKPAFMGSWSADIERDLPSNMMIDVAYVGSNTVHTWTGLENIDQVNPSYLSLGNTLYESAYSADAVTAGIKIPYTGFVGSVAQALRPYPQYTAIYDMYQPTGYANYNSLQVRAQKRFSNGLSFLLAYTFAKELGTPGGDTFGDIYGGGGTYSMNTFNRRIEKSIVSWNQNHTLVASWIYELPFGRGKRFLPNISGPVNQILGGWQINSIETYNSGTPIGVGGGPDIPLFGGGNRPNWISKNVRTAAASNMGSFDPNVDLYLNINAFSQPAPFTFGDGPPILPDTRTPAYYDEDFSIFKKFPIFSEARYLEFRAEFFDIFNRVCFGGPNANINSPTTFGIIGYQNNTPRVIQFGLKLIF